MLIDTKQLKSKLLGNSYPDDWLKKALLNISLVERLAVQHKCYNPLGEIKENILQLPLIL